MSRLAVSLLIVLAVGVRAAGVAPAPSARTSIGPDGENACDPNPKPARLDFSLKDINAASVKLSEFKNKVIVLNFWATWCVPCKAEIPDFVDLQTRYGKEGLQVVGVSVDDPLAALTSYTRQVTMNYPVLQGRGHDAILDAYLITTVPMTVVIRRDGRVCRTHSGAIAKNALEREIKSLL